MGRPPEDWAETLLERNDEIAMEEWARYVTRIETAHFILTCAWDEDGQAWRIMDREGNGDDEWYHIADALAVVAVLEDELARPGAGDEEQAW